MNNTIWGKSSLPPWEKMHQPNIPLVEELLCPVSYEILTKAVHLLPCLHIVQERIGQEIMSNETPLCPVCKRKVDRYANEEKIRKICAIVLPILEQKLTNSLPKYPFPKLKIVLTHNSKNTLIFVPLNHRKHISSILFRKFELNNGLYVAFKFMQAKMKNYLKSCGLEVQGNPLEFSSQNSEEVTKLAQILLDNNEFSNEAAQALRKLIPNTL